MQGWDNSPDSQLKHKNIHSYIYIYTIKTAQLHQGAKDQSSQEHLDQTSCATRLLLCSMHSNSVNLQCKCFVFRSIFIYAYSTHKSAT